MRRLWVFTGGGLIGGAFYLLLIDTTSLPELYVLAAVAVVCAAAFLLAREQGFVEGRIRPWWLIGIARAALEVPVDIGVLCREAIVQLLRPRPARGEFRAVPFAATQPTAQDAGRRAPAKWLGSVTPNTIVVGVDPDRALLLVHQLHERGGAEQAEVMGLG